MMRLCRPVVDRISCNRLPMCLRLTKLCSAAGCSVFLMSCLELLVLAEMTGLPMGKLLDHDLELVGFVVEFSVCLADWNLVVGLWW